MAAAQRRWQRGSKAAVQRKSWRQRRRWQQHLAGSVASVAALTFNNQLKVATAAATEMATMTATTMTMETKATVATCCCLHHRHRQCHAIAKLPPPPPSWQLPTRCCRASAAAVAFGRMAGDDKESSGRCNQQPPLPQRWFCRNRRWVQALPTIPPTPFRRFYA